MIEKPKKERRFLKILGKVGEILVQELLIKVGKSLVQKIGGKKNLPSIIFLLLFYNIAYASIDSIPYPITGNKQRLGWQTSGNGLVWRGRASDTITKPSNYANKDIKAYMLVDTVNNVMYSYIASKGGWKFNNSDTVIIQGATMPFDSITFNTAKDGTVGVGEVEYNDTQGSLIQGLKGGNVTNVLGQQLHQRVNNRTGAPLAKGDVVYLSGSQGNRITVAKAIATSDPTSANTFGIVAESIADNASGYVITEGLITGLNTSALIQDSAVYLSGTTAGALTSTKPQAPIHGVYIGVCVKSNAGSGEIFVKIRNGQELDELHDVQITSPVNNASLYYKSSEGLWRDTTPALLVSDTAAMLTPYFRYADTTLLNLTSRFAAKLNLSDTLNMLVPYLRKADTTNMLLPYFRDADTTSLNLTSRFAAKLNLSDTASMLTNYLRTGVAASTYLTQSNAASTYLPLTGGTLTGDLNTKYLNTFAKTTYTPFNVGIGEQSIFNVGTTLRGGTVMFFPDSNLVGSSANIFLANSSVQGVEYSAMGSGMRNYAKQGGDSRRNSLAFYTSGIGSQNTNRLFIDYDGNVGINDDTPSYKLDVNGTLAVSGATNISNTLSATTGTFTGLNVNNTTTEGIFTLQGYDNNTATRIQFKTDNIVRQEIIKPTSASNLQFRSYPTGTAQGGYEFYVSNGISESLAATIATDKSLSLTGTLGVTGATTLSAPLTVNSSAVFNEGSADADFRVESDGNANMVFVDASTDRVGIGTNAPTKTLDVNGEVKIATTTATPTSLLGKDGSNVVGEVTTVAQTGLMKAGGTTANTSSVGIITVAHGLSYTPSQVIATVAQQNSYVIVCHAKDGTNMSFTVYDSVTGNALNNVSVGFFWLAIK